MIGHYQDTYPRGYVLDGWDPQNPTKMTKSLPVAVEATPSGRVAPQFIWPGMVITPSKDGTHWVRGVEKETTPTVVAIAQDASTDFDVLSADSLVGLLCSDSFKIASPFFARGEGNKNLYKTGTTITFCTNDEKENRTVNGSEVELSLSGFFKPAAKDSVVIGTVIAQFTGKNGAQAVSTESEPTTTNSLCAAQPLQETFGTAVNSHALKDNAYLVHFVTTFQPAAPAGE